MSRIYTSLVIYIYKAIMVKYCPPASFDTFLALKRDENKNYYKKSLPEVLILIFKIINQTIKTNKISYKNLFMKSQKNDVSK